MTTTTTTIEIKANMSAYGWTTDVQDHSGVSTRARALLTALEDTGARVGHVLVQNLWDSRLAIMPQNTSCRLSAIEML